GVGECQLRIQPQSLQVRRLRVEEAFEDAKGIAEIVSQDGRVRVEAHGFLAVRQRFFAKAAVQERLAEIGLSGCEQWFQRDRAAEMIKRSIAFPQVAQRDA